MRQALPTGHSDTPLHALASAVMQASMKQQPYLGKPAWRGGGTQGAPCGLHTDTHALHATTSLSRMPLCYPCTPWTHINPPCVVGNSNLHRVEAFQTAPRVRPLPPLCASHGPLQMLTRPTLQPIPRTVSAACGPAPFLPTTGHLVRVSLVVA